MKRRAFVGGALAGASITGAWASGDQGIRLIRLLRSLSPTERLRYVLSRRGVRVTIRGGGTQGQMKATYGRFRTSRS